MNHTPLASFIWSVADHLRGDYKQSDYGKVVLPFTLLRRLDCVLEGTKAAVLAEFDARKSLNVPLEQFLIRKSKQTFYNTSPLDFQKLLADSANIKANLTNYISSFSENAREIFDRYEFIAQVEKLDATNLLYQVVQLFSAVDLHPKNVSNADMGMAFEELIRRFAELSNETAGEHFTPREVIRLMVNILFIEDDEALTQEGIVRSLYDPTAGTGGMLSTSGEHLEHINPKAKLVVFGQELNGESYAICKADMLIKGQDVGNIIFGNTLSEDGHHGQTFDYMLSNPPFGVEWKKVETVVRAEHEQQGFAGRFGPGLPRVSDGSLLFLMHLCAKMRPVGQGGSRIGIVLNGSPLFTGGAGSGESEIRRYVLENDLVEAIIGLPTDMFYNTGISTYVWILSNRKPEHRKGFVQLVDASSFWQKMRKALGSKRKELSEEHISSITRLFGECAEAKLATSLDAQGKEISRQILAAGAAEPETPAGGNVKVALVSRVFRNKEFGYRTITVERPLRDENGKIALGERGKLKGKPQPDSSLRGTENVPLNEDVETYFKREVLPHAPDAWIDHEKTKIGYEVPFNRYFYVFQPPRELSAIDADLKRCTDRILQMIGGLSA